jgi:protein TonB
VNRFFIATPIALLLSISVFSFMAFMVSADSSRHMKKADSLAFNMVMVEEDSAIQRRQRAVPEKPETPRAPEQPIVRTSNTPAPSNISSVSSMTLGLDTSISGLEISSPEFGDFGVTQNVMPLSRVEPNYPSRALKRNIEGSITLSFNIDPNGRTVDIKVTSAQPKRIFDREAIRAIKKWRFQPKVVDGVAVSQFGMSQTIEFKMNK